MKTVKAIQLRMTIIRSIDIRRVFNDCIQSILRDNFNMEQF